MIFNNKNDCHFDISLPWNTSSWVGFVIAMLIELCVGWPFLIGVLAFQVIYFTICTYIQSCFEDMQLIVSDVNAAIQDKYSAKQKYIEFIKFHNDCCW